MINNFALIIGAMKCGTSSLYRYLAEHPQIAPARIKEPNFFADDENWAKGIEWYQDLWDFDPSIHSIALEGSTHYTKLPDFVNAAERISQIDANFKFIYIMRNPFSRIESHYVHGQYAGWKFAEKRSIRAINEHSLNVTRYAMQISNYYEKFPKENIFLLTLEELKETPEQILRELCRFLEIDPNYQFQSVYQVYNSKAKRVESGRSKVAHYPWLKQVKPLARFMPKALKDGFHQMFGRKLEADFKLSEEQKDYILKSLSSDLKQLHLQYGVDISRWGIDATSL